MLKSREVYTTMTIYSVYCWKEFPIGWWSKETIEKTEPFLVSTPASSEENSAVLSSEMYPEYAFFTPIFYNKAGTRTSEIKVKHLFRVNDLTGKIELVQKQYTIIPRKKKSIDWYAVGKGEG